MMEGRDKTEVNSLGQVGPNGWENYTAKQDSDARFWISLRKQVAHGPAVRVVSRRRGR
jgi:hypothetical protein